MCLLDYPDGTLAGVGLETLRADVAAMIDRMNPDLLLVFDEGGITGHADHARATEAAPHAAHPAHLPVVAWALPEDVATVLNREFGTTFCGRRLSELDFRLSLDRVTQRRAIACHASQARDNAVLWRRLELLGHAEWLLILDGHGD